MATHDNSTDQLTLVQHLAEAVSTQARVANRTWYVLMSVAMLTLLPRRSTGTNPGVKLPFDLGDVDPSTFYVVAFLMLLVLAIAFAAAHAQQIRSQILAQKTVDTIAKDGRIIQGIHPRDYFDMVRMPSVTRVAPLAQLLQGKSRSYTHPTAIGLWHRRASMAYYILLKIVSQLVYFVLPAVALWHAYTHLEIVGPLLYLLTFGGVIAATALLQVALVDFKYFVEVFLVLADSKKALVHT